jgi:hypothetical protein
MKNNDIKVDVKVVIDIEHGNRATTNVLGINDVQLSPTQVMAKASMWLESLDCEAEMPPEIKEILEKTVKIMGMFFLCPLTWLERTGS